jgi:hypothetical protein
MIVERVSKGFKSTEGKQRNSQKTWYCNKCANLLDNELNEWHLWQEEKLTHTEEEKRSKQYDK